MATIANDLFTEGANTALNLHVPSPTGTSWTLESAQFQVIASLDSVQHNRSAIDRAREGTSIGADQMDVSADCLVNSSNVRVAGVCGRMSTDGFVNQYEAFLQWRNATQQDVYLYKNVGGVRTQLGSSPQTITLAQNTYATLLLQIRTGTQTVKVNGSTVISATEADSTLSGRTYAGILMNGATTGNAKVDNYLSESVTGGGAVAIAASDTVVVRFTLLPTGSLSISATDTLAIAVLFDDTSVPQISWSGLEDLLSVALTEVGTIASTAMTTAKVGTDTAAVKVSEVATILATIDQKVGLDPIRVTLNETGAVLAPSLIIATDALTVTLNPENGVSIRKIVGIDTVVIRHAVEGVNIVQNTITATPPTQMALVWRLTSGDTARLPHLASRDLEL